MSLIDLASLVLAPTATKEGKVYSAIPDTGEGDMTFTRGSAATRVNSEGLIEKERGNLLLQSNTFDTTWIKSNATILTLSAYAKAGTSNFLLLEVTRSGGVFYAWFDLSSGVVGTTSAIDANIESVGNGWYRCSLIGNQTLSGQVRLRVADSNGSTVTTTSSNIYIQDAMLNQGLVSTDVITTTTSAVYEGITDDVPRVDYSGGGCPSLLLESQRTNELPYSEYFGASSWLLDGGTQSITTNYAISPEGVQNATRLQLNKTGVTYSRIYGDAGSLGQATISVYMKSNTSETQNVGLRYDGTGINCEVTTEWQRFDLTATSTSVSRFQILLFDSIAGNDETADILIYGAMLESSVTYASSYIPTYSVSSTRVADFAIKSNASNLIGQTEGTIFIEFTRENNSVGTFSISANNVGTRIYIGTNESGLICQVRNGYAQQVYFSTAQTEGTKYKCAIAYATNDFVLYMNGTQIGTDTSGTVPECNTIRTDDAGGANLNQPLNQAILFPTRLTNDQLEELTK